MASRYVTVAAPVNRTFRTDRIVLAAATAFALLSILVAWQTFGPRADSGTAIDELEAARPVASLAIAPSGGR